MSSPDQSEDIVQVSLKSCEIYFTTDRTTINYLDGEFYRLTANCYFQPEIVRRSEQVLLSSSPIVLKSVHVGNRIDERKFYASVSLVVELGDGNRVKILAWNSKDRVKIQVLEHKEVQATIHIPHPV